MTQVEFDNHHKIIVILPTEMPNDEDFELWASLYLHASEITLGEFSAGADRHQMRFTYQQHNFNLHFEHYSQSVWVTAEGVAAEHLLAALTYYFINQ